MNKTRLEAFSDGVLAVIITIMVSLWQAWLMRQGLCMRRLAAVGRPAYTPYKFRWLSATACVGCPPACKQLACCLGPCHGLTWWVLF